MHLNILKQTFDMMDKLLDNSAFIMKNKYEKKYFSRKRTLDFKTIFFAVCSSQKRSLHTELSSFLIKASGKVSTFSNQAFSKARYKIKSEAFYTVFREAVKLFCKQKNLKHFRGYRILAVDGTSLLLPDTPENRKEFGSCGNNQKTYASGSASVLYDVLNDVILDATMGKCYSSERQDCYDMLERTGEEFTGSQKLILMDRGYIGREMYHFLEKRNYKYVIRIPNASNTPSAIRNTQLPDCIVTDEKDKTIVQRIIRIPLSSGETELLVTNLFDQKYTIQDFYELYHMRWSIEEKYLEIKHKTELEKFTGYKPEGMRQDFFATLLLANLSSELKHATEERKKGKEKNKWNYQISTTAVINVMRENITRIFFEPENRQFMLEMMAEVLKNKRSAIRPNRHAERKKPRVVKRYSMNHK